MTTANPGAVTWIDLTVEAAERVGAFYGEVVGWRPEGVEMDGYEDFMMNRPGDGECVAGICHARGPNAGLPPAWLVYITVADLDHSVARCRDLGGEILVGPKGMGDHGRFCVIRDPAGAVSALFEPAVGS